MKPIWNNPREWEDFKNGMFNSRADDSIIKQCYEVLKNNPYIEMKLTTIEYVKSSEVNLSKRVWNNQAWLGQATCNRLFGATIQETTKAWSLLTLKEKKYANKSADIVIEEWRNEKI